MPSRERAAMRFMLIRRVGLDLSRSAMVHKRDSAAFVGDDLHLYRHRWVWHHARFGYTCQARHVDWASLGLFGGESRWEFSQESVSLRLRQVGFLEIPQKVCRVCDTCAV